MPRHFASSGSESPLSSNEEEKHHKGKRELEHPKRPFPLPRQESVHHSLPAKEEERKRLDYELEPRNRPPIPLPTQECLQQQESMASLLRLVHNMDRPFPLSSQECLQHDEESMVSLLSLYLGRPIPLPIPSKEEESKGKGKFSPYLMRLLFELPFSQPRQECVHHSQPSIEEESKLLPPLDYELERQLRYLQLPREGWLTYQWYCSMVGPMTLDCHLPSYRRLSQESDIEVKHFNPPKDFPYPAAHYNPTEHYNHYLQLVKESEEYYTPIPPGGVQYLYQTRTPATPDEVEEFAKDALGWYSRKSDVSLGCEMYEFVRAECGSRMFNNDVIYKIAFIARGVDSGLEVPFRAQLVLKVARPMEVRNCEKVAESCAKFTRLNGGCC